MRLLDGYAIVKDEEETARHMLTCFLELAHLKLLGKLVILDNGSTDDTPNIVESFEGLFQNLGATLERREQFFTPHHGELRTLAIQGLQAPWIFYLDADETFGLKLPDGIKKALRLWQEGSDHLTVAFSRYYTVGDCYHWSDAYEPFQIRMFRNLPGVHFPQKIHTEPVYPFERWLVDGRDRVLHLQDYFFFDHTGCKSDKALLDKGARYQWAAGEPFINGPDWYKQITDEAKGKIQSLPPEVLEQVWVGPGYKEE